MVKVNFADIQESNDLPIGGPYHVQITDGDIGEHGDEAKHPGNEFWRVEITVQDGPLEGKSATVLITLPPYEPFTLANILRASVGQHEFTEEQLRDGDFDVSLDDLVDNNLEMLVKVNKRKGSDYVNYRFSPYDPETWDPGDSELP
jgi:hypothetical protein